MSPFRFDDDLSDYRSGASRQGLDALKFVPLGADPSRYLSFGGDFRERLETADPPLLGLRSGTGDTVDLHRLLVHGDLHLDQLRVFVQVGQELELGREPTALPTDVDRADLAQAFADYRVGDADRSVTLRTGRFEMSFDDGALISLRDGPNVRQSWDGARIFDRFALGQADLFAVRPVAVKPGRFDDGAAGGQSLWGLHLDLAPRPIAPVKLNTFFYDSTMSRVSFYPRAASEHTETVGIRGRMDGPLDGSVGAMMQTGRFGGLLVRAWSSHLDVGWTFQHEGWQPRLGLRGDVLSGGQHPGVVHTFNPLYPNYAFSTEATIEAPANLIQAGASLDLHPRSGVLVQWKAEGLWRYAVTDAFYAAPTFALVAPGAIPGARYSGSEQQLRTSWQVNRVVNLTAAYVHFDPAPFLRASRAVAENFGMAEFTLRL